MTTPERRQSGWWGSISGGLFAKRRADADSDLRAEGLGESLRAPAIEDGAHRDTPRPRVTFQEPRPGASPESPVLRASSAQLAQRKILERPQGPSSRLSSSVSANTVARTTNFSAAAAASPRPMFRASSAAAEGNRFSFTPRAGTPAKPLNGSLRATTTSANTPSRDFRASTADISRGMARIPPSELFSMKIDEPPSNLSGEELAKRVPREANRAGSIYADEYLEHLCPKDFTEIQRKQFFCILDLRRLKYAADEIFVKKDWKFNILNFAKEYEKSRSLIMLRYGLYEFKTIKPSQEVVSKWKATHGIPNEDGEGDSTPTPATTLPRTNGTEGILSRGAGKRKAEEPAKSSGFAASQNKRARGVDREPLTESSTPALNKSGMKRGANDDAGNPPAKMQKAAAPTPSKTPSATKKFFEQVANSKPVSSPTISVEPPTATKPKASINTFSSAFGTPKASATRSLFEATASKAASAGKLSTGSNIFGHLSDAGSAQASGAENDAEDEDDSDDEAQEVSQSDDPSAAASGGVATPQPVSSLFGKKVAGGAFVSSSSSETGEAAAAPNGPSLFDRITKGDDGKPKRVLSPNGPFGSPAPSMPAPDTEKAPSPAKEQRPLPAGNNTWTPDTPIKFAAPKESSLFGSSTPAAKAPCSEDSAKPASSLFNFGAKPAGDISSPAPKFGGVPSGGLFGASVNGSASSMFGLDKKTESTPAAASTPTPAAPAQPSSNLFGSTGASFSGLKPVAPTPAATTPVPAKPETSTPAPHPMFGAVPGEASKPSFGVDGTADVKSVFGASKQLFGADPKADAAAKPMFGAAPKGDAFQAKPLFGADPKSDASQAKPAFGLGTPASTPLFGASSETPKPLFGAPTSDAPKPAFGTPAVSSETPKPMFGLGAAKDTPKPMFGLGAAQETPKPTFGGLGAANGTPAPPLFGAASGSDASKTSSLFGAAPAGGASATPFGAAKRTSEPEETGAPSAKRTMFGSAGDAASLAAKPLFSASTTSSAPVFNFGASATEKSEAPKPQSTLFGASTPAATPTPSFSFGASTTQPQNVASTPSFSFGGAATANGTSTPTPSFSFGGPAQTNGQASAQNSTLFGSGSTSAPSSFTFGAGGAGEKSFNNPFQNGASAASSVSFNFGGPPSQPAAGAPSGMFNFGASAAPNGAPAPGVFSFGSQANGAAPAAAPSAIFNLAPPMGGTSTGTNTPFTLGGASSLATTPANGTPEPGATDRSDADGQKADGDEEPQAQINLSEGGPGEEDEDVVFEVRAKALKLCEDDDEDKKAASKSPWKTQGVGPLRMLKHKTTGAVRIVLRAEPSGKVAMNKLVLDFIDFKTSNGDKYVKVPTASDDGGPLETWMLQVKDKEKGQALAAALNEHKVGNKPKA